MEKHNKRRIFTLNRCIIVIISRFGLMNTTITSSSGGRDEKEEKTDIKSHCFSMRAVRSEKASNKDNMLI